MNEQLFFHKENDGGMKIVQTFLKKIVGAIYNLVVVLVMVLAGLIALSTFDTPIKFRLFAVLSGSMEPAIPMGSLVVVLPQTGYQVDDVITVKGEKNPKETVTHRIIEVQKGSSGRETQYKLQGDANEEADLEMIPLSRVIGKVRMHIPYVGRGISFAQTQQGFIALIVVPATILLYSEAVAAKQEVVKMIRKKDTPHKQMVIITPARSANKSTTQQVPVSKNLKEPSVAIRKPPQLVKQSQKPLYERPSVSVKNFAQQKIQHVLHIDGQGEKITISV